MKIYTTDHLVIERKNDGIPLIKSNSEKDMYFGLGYCHAIDRGMQMMMMKILGTGTASEYLSGDDDMLEIDIVLLARMAGFLTMAQSQREMERLFVQKGVQKDMLHELFS